MGEVRNTLKIDAKSNALTPLGINALIVPFYVHLNDYFFEYFLQFTTQELIKRYVTLCHDSGDISTAIL